MSCALKVDNFLKHSEEIGRFPFHVAKNNSEGNFMDHISVTLCRSSMKSGGAHRDALQLGLPFHLDAYLEHAHIDQRFPCGRISCLPYYGTIGSCEYVFEPAFIRKRNERERLRVHCVNEGYARLREHLPQEFKEKRLSKVETLRAAMHYIKHLQSLLNLNAFGMQADDAGPQRSESSSDERPRAGAS